MRADPTDPGRRRPSQVHRSASRCSQATGGVVDCPRAHTCVARGASMRAHLRPLLVAALLAGSLGVAGCGGGPSPDTAPTPSASAPTASTTPATPTASPTPSASASPTAPTLPASARARSKAGAVAFARHYVQLINYAGASGDTVPLQGNSLTSCVKCHDLSKGIDKIYDSGGFIAGGGWKVVAARSFGFRGDYFFVDLAISSSPQVVVQKTGAPARTFPGAKRRLRSFVLRYNRQHWRLAELDPTA